MYMNTMSRPDWNEYFKEIVQVTSRRSPSGCKSVVCL